jgi:transposase, IS30 family
VTQSFQRRRSGPGTPLTAQRELYLRLLAPGFSNAEACPQVGINRKTGERWRHGRRLRVNHREYKYGPISLAPTKISARFLAEDERLQIADLNRLGIPSAR